MTEKAEKTIHIVGGGLAGCEAAWQALGSGAKVILHEMRPQQLTPAHKTGNLAELVCSNSLKSVDSASAPGRLKEEMAAMNSLIIRAAYEARVPAGAALAVEREVFSAFIKGQLEAEPAFSLQQEEVTYLPSCEELQARNEAWIIASGPLTSDPLAKEIEKLCGEKKRLYFYDAIAPILAADSLDVSACFHADRYGKGDGDYLNIPLDKAQYEAFIEDIRTAEKMPLHSFEKPQYFEACLPLEVMVERGPDTLRFGPLKPVGMIDPRTGQRPYANIQLRKENQQASIYSLVGFQTKMKWPEQKRVFSRLPGLGEVEFLRYGSVHRNTYVQSPYVLQADLSFRHNPNIFLAGQITGVEGYTESAAIGLLAGRLAAQRLGLARFTMPPADTVIGALAHYITQATTASYAPMNANLGLLPDLKRGKGVSKQDKKKQQCELAKIRFEHYLCETSN